MAMRPARAATLRALDKPGDDEERDQCEGPAQQDEPERGQ